MKYEKRCVEVVARFFEEGGMRPLSIRMQDGMTYAVERVRFCERSPSEVGAILPVRYTVVVEGRELQLFYEPSKEQWFYQVPCFTGGGVGDS